MTALDQKNPVYILAGAGTGGHLYPAIAIGEMILQLQPQSKICFIGTKKGLETRVVPAAGHQLLLIAVRGFSRKNVFANIIVLGRLLVSLGQCMRILYKIKPAAVIGSGGYVSGPMLFMAVLLGYPTLIQEQNSYPGMTTRWLSKWVDRVHISFTESAAFFKRQDNLVLTGNPVRAFQNITDKQAARSVFNLQPDKLTMLVFGGSQGALAVNKAVITCLETIMKETDLQVIWGTGKTAYPLVADAVTPWKNRVFAAEYINNMDMAYAASDFALCRSGAITLAELAVCGIPSLLIPYPFAAAGHQEKNARAFAKIGAAEMILEAELNRDTLFERITELYRDPQKRETMRRAALNAAFPDATKKIVNSVFEIANKGTK